MHWLDTVILGVLAFGALFGACAGFLWQLSRIISVALGAYCTIVFNEPATVQVQRHLLTEAPAVVAQLVAYVLVFVLVCLAMFVLTMALHRVVLRVNLQWLNRLLGAVFGTLKAALVLGIVFLTLSSFSGPQETIQKSRLAQSLANGMRAATTLLPDAYREQIDGQLENADRLPQRLLDQGKKAAGLPSGL